jgi:hypothetical protein
VNRQEKVKLLAQLRELIAAYVSVDNQDQLLALVHQKIEIYRDVKNVAEGAQVIGAYITFH